MRGLQRNADGKKGEGVMIDIEQEKKGGLVVVTCVVLAFMFGLGAIVGFILGHFK